MHKLEALRQAQLTFIHGKSRADNDGPGRGAVMVSSGKVASDADHPYAHPYYWAPFFLMGNWL